MLRQQQNESLADTARGSQNTYQMSISIGDGVAGRGRLTNRTALEENWSG